MSLPTIHVDTLDFDIEAGIASLGNFETTLLRVAVVLPGTPVGERAVSAAHLSRALRFAVVALVTELDVLIENIGAKQ